MDGLRAQAKQEGDVGEGGEVILTERMAEEEAEGGKVKTKMKTFEDRGGKGEGGKEEDDEEEGGKVRSKVVMMEVAEGYRLDQRRHVDERPKLQIQVTPRQEAAASGAAVASSEGGPWGQVIEVELNVEDSEALLSLSEELEKILDSKNTLRTPPPSIELSPLECHALQQDELEALRAIYDHDLTSLNNDCTCFAVDVKFLSDEIKEEDVIKIWFSLPPNYPCVPPVFEIEANRSGSFTYRDADELFDLLMAESINKIGGMMVFDLVTFAQEYMPGLVERKKEQAVRQAALDLDRKRTMELEEALRDATTSKGVPPELWSVLLKDHISEGEEKQKKEEEEEGGIGDEWEAMETKYGYQNLGTYRPVHFVGPISDIVKKLPEGLQITRIENILRQDLADRFDRCRKSAVKALWQKERRMPQMFNLKPQIAFHGTQHTSLPSIVQRGLIIPGVSSDVRVCHGSSLGVGIYLSPNADFSLHYSDSNRLIVCAALLGRVYKGGYSHDKHSSAYHCFMSDCGSEWVFFNAAQVLPCYVIQVKSQPTKKKVGVYNPPPLASLLEESVHPEQAGDLTEKERKAKLLARARKFLPYGFGPGGKTVIEDAASFDDDEEDYGDYQLLRYTEDNDQSYDRGLAVREDSELQKYRYRDPKEVDHKS